MNKTVKQQKLSTQSCVTELLVTSSNDTEDPEFPIDDSSEYSDLDTDV